MTLLTAQERFNRNHMPEPNSGCWLWEGRLTGGYGSFYMETPKRRTTAHRGSWLLHRGPIPDGLVVCHKCDNRACVNPAHLFLGTYAENMQDASRKGRMNWRPGEVRNLPRGEDHHGTKLTVADVVAIRSSEMSGVALAARYGITPTSITRIRKRKVWRHVS